MTQYEIKGLEALFKYLTSNMRSKPEEMNVKDLVDEAQKMINEHLEDDTGLVVEDSDENMSIEDSEVISTTTNVEKQNIENLTPNESVETAMDVSEVDVESSLQTANSLHSPDDSEYSKSDVLRLIKKFGNEYQIERHYRLFLARDIRIDGLSSGAVRNRLIRGPDKDEEFIKFLARILAKARKREEERLKLN